MKLNQSGSLSIEREIYAELWREQGDECGLLLVGEVEGNGKWCFLCVRVYVSTHLIGIMFQRAVITHISHTIQICVSLVNIVDIGTVVLLIQNAW